MRRALATRPCYLAALITLLLFSSRPGIAWESWGGDPGGSRFSPLREITPDNVGNLVRAFEFHTGDLAARPPGVMRRTKFQATPLFVEDSLVFCSPFNEVIALDPGTGAQKWRYDPKIAINQRPANRYVCRGVTYWIDDEAPVDATCRSRIFMGTNDVRLIALTMRRRESPAPASATTVRSGPISARSWNGRANSRSPRRRRSAAVSS
ncbi:glucose dehydrogenase [Bradyrhizobium sp. LB9.1b]